MFQIIANQPVPLKNFINQFAVFFSKRLFISFAIYFSGLFIEFKRTSINSISSKSSDTSYQNLQYFISDSNWNSEFVNSKRLDLLATNPATRSTKKGVLVIDDSSCKKWGTNTQGAKPQYSSVEDKTINCNVVVTSAYCDNKKRYPINLKPYIPKDDPLCTSLEVIFQSKLNLAADLIDHAIKHDINFSDIVFDSWYFCNDLVKYIMSLKKYWISEAQADRRISYRRQWVRADELVKLIPSSKFNRKVTLTHSNGKSSSFLVYGFKTFLKGFDKPLFVVVAVGKWDSHDPKNVHIFVTNHLTLYPEDVVKRYALRWGIECIFKDLKEFVAFDNYQVRSIKAISHHWHLCVLAYTFLLWGKITSGLSHRLKNKRLKTLGDALRAIRSLSSVEALNWANSNQQAFAKVINIEPKFMFAA